MGGGEYSSAENTAWKQYKHRGKNGKLVKGEVLYQNALLLLTWKKPPSGLTLGDLLNTSWSSSPAQCYTAWNSEVAEVPLLRKVIKVDGEMKHSRVQFSIWTSFIEIYVLLLYS